MVPDPEEVAMATVKRTTTTVRTPQRQAEEKPEQAAAGGRWPEVDQGLPTEPEGPDPDQPEAETEEVVTVGQEQLGRSQEIEAMGVENWKAAHDERGPDYQQQQVEGVGPHQEETYGERSSRR
jgi:hypothetical protein